MEHSWKIDKPGVRHCELCKVEQEYCEYVSSAYGTSIYGWSWQPRKAVCTGKKK